MAVHSSSTSYRVRGHLIADLDPLRWKVPRCAPSSTRPLRSHDLGPRPRIRHRRSWAGRARRSARSFDTLRDAYCHTIGIEYMHIQELEEQKRWIQDEVEARASRPSTSRRALHPRSAQRGRSVREVPAHQVRSARSGSARGGRESAFRCSTISRGRGRRRDGRRVMGMAHRGRLNVLANILGKHYDQIFREFEGDDRPGPPSRDRAT